jgi:sugar phosphate isomerase/epimerase
MFSRQLRRAYRKGLEDWANNTFASFKATGHRLAAFATYFPDISSMHDDDFLAAIHGLSDAIVLASHASNKYDIMTAPIVEAVCGVLAEPCRCKKCSSQRRVVVFKDTEKQDRLIRGLHAVVRKVRRLLKNRPNKSFSIGLELEPGSTYVLRDKNTLFELMTRIESDPVLREHVGLNLDVGHMRIANISASDLEPHINQIVHAHISDHPGMHTRDQVLGAWTNVSHLNEFDEYIVLLSRREKEKSGPLLFSGAIAIELEGCNRLEWVLASLRDLKRLLLRNNVTVQPQANSAWGSAAVGDR